MIETLDACIVGTIKEQLHCGMCGFPLDFDGCPSKSQLEHPHQQIWGMAITAASGGGNVTFTLQRSNRGHMLARCVQSAVTCTSAPPSDHSLGKSALIYLCAR